MQQAASDLRVITWRYERIRAIATGVLETALDTFLLLILVRQFQADASVKGFSVFR